MICILTAAVTFSSAAFFLPRGKGIFNFLPELRLFTPFHSIQNDIVALRCYHDQSNAKLCRVEEAV